MLHILVESLPKNRCLKKRCTQLFVSWLTASPSISSAEMAALPFILEQDQSSSIPSGLWPSAKVYHLIVARSLPIALT